MTMKMGSSPFFDVNILHNYNIANLMQRILQLFVCGELHFQKPHHHLTGVTKNSSICHRKNDIFPQSCKELK